MAVIRHEFGIQHWYRQLCHRTMPAKLHFQVARPHLATTLNSSLRLTMHSNKILIIMVINQELTIWQVSSK